MNAPNLELACRLSRRSLYVALASCGICACSDPLSTPVPGAASDGEVVITMPEGRVAAGDVVWLALDLVRPCWNESATADVDVSWDASRFELSEALPGGHTGATAADVAGWARLQLTDRDGFSGGLRIPFVARAATEADGFRLESLSIYCGVRRLDRVHERA